MKWIFRWYVRSHSRLDKEYTVSLAEDKETWGCSCPAWIYKRHQIRDGICKHIRQVKSYIEDMTEEEIIHSQNILPDNIVLDEFFKEEEFAL